MNNKKQLEDMRQMWNRLVAGVVLLGAAILTGKTALAESDFYDYRDLAVYTTSQADRQQVDRIIAATQFVNRGKKALALSVRLAPAPEIGFTGTNAELRVRAGEQAVLTWTFAPPVGFARTVVTGDVAFNGRLERDLYLAILGADPPGTDARHIEPITERARVVATYAPRRRQSVLNQLARMEADRPRPVCTLAATGTTAFVIQTDLLPVLPEGREAWAFWRDQKMEAPLRELVEALQDLRRVVQLKTGADLPVRARSKGPAIVLRKAGPGRRAKDLQDAYRLRVSRDRVLIEADTADGLRNGIYGLLTDHMDCHWFMPGQLGEEIGLPADRAIRLPALDEVQGSPWFSTSGSRRNRAMVNRGRMTFGHAWARYINEREYPYDQYPHYYARDRAGAIRKVLNPGASFTGFCTTEPDVLDIVARKVNAYFEANPDAIVVSLDPNDYSPMCLCDRCLALDKRYGQTREDGTEVADRLLHFSREIADRLDPRFRNRFLGILVYGYQMAPPVSATAHPRHVGLICDMFWTYDHSRPWTDPTSSRNRLFREQILAWGRILPQFGYYEYTGNAEYFGPWGLVHKIREDLPAFRELGGTFLMPEAQPLYATQGLNLYVSDRLSWDLTADVDLLLEEFYTRFYGPAADPMRDYWQAVERLYALERPGSRPERRVCARPEVWTELDNHLQRAARLVATVQPEQKRFADRVQFARDGLEYGRLIGIYMKETQRRPVDHAEVLAFLKRESSHIQELVARYPPNDPYWPPLAPAWALNEYRIDRLVEKHQQALKPSLPGQ